MIIWITSFLFCNSSPDDLLEVAEREEAQEGWEIVVLLCALGIMISYADAW